MDNTNRDRTALTGLRRELRSLGDWADDRLNEDYDRQYIAEHVTGGFVLLAEFTRTGLRSIGADLGVRWEEYDVPKMAEIAAADAELAFLGLIRTVPWQPGSVIGSLTAALTRIPCSTTAQTRVRDRFRTAIRRLLPREEVTR